jgi:uncharacterized protein (TIGR02246 family)
LRILARLSLLFAAIGCADAFAASARDASQIDAIRLVQAQQAAAWNSHDAAAYAALFANDADVVNVLGWWWRGRPTIQGKLTGAFAWVFRDSKMSITDVKVKMLTPTIALAHVKWQMEGAKVPPGAAEPPREGIQLQVLRNEHGHWLIESFQNTNAFPETPFPTGPPAPATSRP